MNFSGGKKLLLFFLVLPLNSFINCTVINELLPKAANAIADYFSANCVHFLSSYSSKGTFMNHGLAKIMSLENDKFFSFSNISSYYNFLKIDQNGQCTVPLRIILHFKETELVADFKDFPTIYEDYPVQAKAGLWLIFLKSYNEEFISKVFRNFYLPIDLEILVAWMHEGKVHLKEIFQVSASSSIRESHFGVWDLETGLVSSHPPCRYSKKSNLEGLTFKVGYVENNEPFTMKRSTTKGGALDGYFGNIWHVLEDLLNISTIYVPLKLKRGRGESANSWLRIMKMLKEKKIDVGLGDFVASADRIASFDFSYPLLVSKAYSFQLYYQVASEFPFQIYLFPFQTFVWLLLLNWWILSSLCMFVARRFSEKKEKIIFMPTYFFIIFGGLCAQSSPLVPRSSSCRILFLFTYIMATVMIPSYSAYLTRCLASGPKAVSFNNIFDFYKSGTHEIILVDGSFEYYFFNMRSELSYLKKIFEQLKIKKLPKSYDEAIHMLCTKRNVAFFTITSTFIWQWIQNEHSKLESECVLKKMSQDAGILINSLIFQKNSRFKGIIDHHLKILQESGVIKKIEEEFWMSQPKNRKNNWKTVGLKESFGVFKTAAFGMIVSSAIFILEQCVKKLLKK